jgi:hypothetical protein
MIALSAMLGWILWLWGRELVGERAALCGLFLFALDPNLVAHGYLATTDVGFAAFALLFLYVLWRRSHWALCGVALGLALASKFTAVFLVPIAAGLMLAEGRKWKETARDLLLMGVVASLVVQALYFSPSGLYLYTAGLGMVNRDHNPDYLVFMAGEFDHRFTSYFLVAWMLKTPLATLLSVAAGIGFVLRGKDISRRARLYLFVPPVVLFLVYTLLADDLGIRYILPVLPFLFLVGGVALTRMPRAVAGVLCVWLLVAAIGIWPDHLSYFNEAACLLRDPSKIGFDGGTRCGRYWLDDSNVDWGQGYKQLRAWMEQHGGGRTIKLAGFDSFPATAYGFPVQPLGPTGLPTKPEPGLWAASAHVVARATGSWLQTVEPTAIVGHAIYVWDLK